MKIIKEYAIVAGTETCRVSIHTNVYDKTLQYFNQLLKIAQNDFGPFLTADMVSVVMYGGNRINRIMGIEFNVAIVVVPNDYVKIDSLTEKY